VSGTTDTDATLRQRLAVRATIEAYFSCLDRRDWPGLGECFASDAVATYNSGAAATRSGRSMIVERLHSVERFACTHHAIGNMHIELDGAQARVITQAIAHVVSDTDTGQNILVRGLRYDDTLIIEDGRWRIRRRTHLPLWQYNVPGVPPGL